MKNFDGTYELKEAFMARQHRKHLHLL